MLCMLACDPCIPPPLFFVLVLPVEVFIQWIACLQYYLMLSICCFVVVVVVVVVLFYI